MASSSADLYDATIYSPCDKELRPLLRDIFNIPTTVVNIASEYCIEYTETVMTDEQAIFFTT